MEDRIKQVMASVFEIKVSRIDEKSSPETIATWDSLSHMKLIIALEEEFGIRFNDDEVVELISYALIKSIIREKVTLL